MMSLIDNLNEILNFSLPFPFYQQFNPLFNGISTPLSIGRSILARGSLGPGPGPGPQRAKMLRRIHKGADIPLDKRGKAEKS